MKTQQLKEKSILHLLSQNNFIVPEIQREYVWGNNPEVLERFLEYIIQKIGSSCDTCGNPNSSSKINVGFLYTYKPSYVQYNHERFLDENLIDGQQRFTTLFLLLFYCALKENRIEDFRDAIRFEALNEVAFDYKVRNLTHIFLLDLLGKVDDLTQLDQLLNLRSTWLLKDFNSDVTVISMLNTLKTVVLKFQDRSEKYFNFILNNIKFYHFKTEATNQGEELYITMNARGEALSKNEENKAALMIDDASLFDYGAEWEEWQDYFWKNRDKSNHNSNADIGLNEFLRWIQVIEMTLSDKDLNTDEDDKIDDKSLTKQTITLIQAENIQLNKEYFSIDKIENYFKGLIYLFDDYRFDKTVHIDDNTDSCLLKREWLCPKEKAISQIDAFRFIPVLHFVTSQIKQEKTVNSKDVQRLLRYLFNLTRDSNVTKSINKQVINAIKMVDNMVFNATDIATVVSLEPKLVSKTLLTPEERFKFSIYLNNPNREELETTFWYAEDNNILKGKISPLLQFSYFKDDYKAFEQLKSFYEYEVEKFNLEYFANLYANFEKITSEDIYKISDNIWASMLLTDYYVVRDYSENHKTISCVSVEDSYLIRHRLFLEKLIDIQKFDTSKEYFQHVFDAFLKRYSSLADLQNEDDLKHQLYLYYVVSKNNAIWDYFKGKNFGVYMKPSRFTSFFSLNVRFQHYRQKWHGADYNYFDDNKQSVKKFYSQILPH